MAPKGNCFCNSRTATCVCAFVVIHVILAVTLVSALFTRFYVYRTWVNSDMPSDMRVMDREVSSIFCSEHLLRSSLVDIATSEVKRGQDELASNSVPEFDVYTSDENPKNKSRVKNFYSFSGQGEIVKKRYTYNHFKFLENTTVNVSLCTHYVDEDYIKWHSVRPMNIPDVALIVYLVRGDDLFDDMKEAVEANRSKLPCEKTGCPSMKIPPGGNCTNQSTFTTLEAKINASDEYFVFIYNPVTEFQGQQYRVIYDLNRTEYNLHDFKPTLNYTRTFVANHKYLLLYFNYTRNESANHLYNVKVDYICNSNILMYMTIFFFIPLVIIIAFGVAVMCCYERHMAQYRVLGDQDSIDQNDEPSLNTASGYGSTQAIYT